MKLSLENEKVLFFTLKFDKILQFNTLNSKEFITLTHAATIAFNITPKKTTVLSFKHHAPCKELNIHGNLPLHLQKRLIILYQSIKIYFSKILFLEVWVHVSSHESFLSKINTKAGTESLKV